MRVQAHNCSHQGLGGGSFLRKRLSGASSTYSQPRKGWAYSMAMAILPAPVPPPGITSTPQAYRACSPVPDHWASALPALSLERCAFRLAPTSLLRDTPYPTFPSPCLFPHAQKCPCLCLSFGIHFPKQSSATSALVTRKAQLLQDPGDTKALPEGLRWGERRAPGGPAGLKVGVRGERRGSPRPCWAQSLLWSQEPSVVGVTRVPRQG